jgi:hypothetical protein
LTSEPTTNLTTSEGSADDSNRIGKPSDSPITAEDTKDNNLKIEKEPETHLRLTTRQRENLQLRCIRYLSEGCSISDIMKLEGMTMWHVRQTLDGINREARNSIMSNMIADRLPLSIEVRLETIRILIKKCTHIMNSSKDERVILQSCAQIVSLQEKEAEIYSRCKIISDEIKRVLILPRRHDDSDRDDETDSSEINQLESIDNDGGVGAAAA